MKTTVVLTIEHRLHAQLLKHALASCPDFEVVGEGTGLIDSIALVSATKPRVWIHSWSESPTLSAALSHIYSSNPKIAIIRINPDEPAGFIQMRVNSLQDLMRLMSGTSLLLNSA